MSDPDKPSSSKFKYLHCKTKKNTANPYKISVSQGTSNRESPVIRHLKKKKRSDGTKNSSVPPQGNHDSPDHLDRSSPCESSTANCGYDTHCASIIESIGTSATGVSANTDVSGNNANCATHVGFNDSNIASTSSADTTSVFSNSNALDGAAYDLFNDTTDLPSNIINDSYDFTNVACDYASAGSNFAYNIDNALSSIFCDYPNGQIVNSAPSIFNNFQVFKMPDMSLSSNNSDILLWFPTLCKSSAQTLRGIHCGNFGADKSYSFIAHGPRHLSIWKTGLTQTETDLTKFLPNVTIKKLAPLSADFLGLIVDVHEKDASKTGKLALFDINQSLASNPQNAPTLSLLSDASFNDECTALSEMLANGNDTVFLSAKKNSTNVFVNFLKKTATSFTCKEFMQIKTELCGIVSTICYDSHNNKVISGSNQGQISSADAMTGTLIGNKWLMCSRKTLQGTPISKISMCPENPNLAMATCRSAEEQIKIVDFRVPLAPVMTLGMPLHEDYPEDITPAWSPNNNYIVVPYNQRQTWFDQNYLMNADTRFAKIPHDKTHFHSPLDTETWSVSFGINQLTGGKTMMTAGDDGKIRTFDYCNDESDNDRFNDNLNNDDDLDEESEEESEDESDDEYDYYGF